MPGQRIYYVPPRLVGPVQDWSGRDAHDGASWLVDHVKDLGFNAIWFSPFTVTTGVEKMSHGKKLAGSYYATRDHFTVDPEFSSGDDARDADHLRHFCKRAAEKGVKVYADLVFNHVAADHPLVVQEEAELKAILKKTDGDVDHVRGHKGKLIGVSYEEDGAEKFYYFKFRRRDDMTLQVGGPPEDPWSDVAQINYSSPEARRFFIHGDDTHQGYFKQVIDWYLDRGFSGFRCDAAYLIPPESWQELVQHTRARDKDAVFLAETLCLNQEKVERMSRARITDDTGRDRPAFDLGMMGYFWWNFRDDWLPKEEHPRLLAMSRFGGAGSPDNHDTESTLAGAVRRAFNEAADKRRTDEAVAMISVRNFALSALVGNSYYCQMGYEFCNEKQNHVFRGEVSPQDWKDLVTTRKGTMLDISDRLRDINALKESMGLKNSRVHFKEYGIHDIDHRKIVKVHAEYFDVDTGKKTGDIVLIMNQKPEKGPVALDEKSLGAELAGLSRLSGDGKSVQDVLVYHTPLAPVVQPLPTLLPANDSGKPGPAAPPAPSLDVLPPRMRPARRIGLSNH